VTWQGRRPIAGNLGSAFATFAWRGFSALFSLYAAKFGSFNKTYGSARRGAHTHVGGRRAHDALLSTMKHGRTLGQSGRFTHLEPVIRRTFDIPSMTRLSVGLSWAGLTEAQRQQVTESFGRYISAIYADRFDSYAGHKFQVTGEQPNAGGVTVKSQIIKANGEPVKVDYMNAPQRRGLVDLRHLSRRRDQRTGDPPFRIRRHPQERRHRRPDRGTEPQGRYPHRNHSQIVLTAN
jgi:hypothetical protein